jgi:hypothetical protein
MKAPVTVLLMLTVLMSNTCGCRGKVEEPKKQTSEPVTLDQFRAETKETSVNQN